jgi:hypothetical protein
MAPLITIFGFAYFCLVFLINRYNLIYVNEQRWQGGGACVLFFFLLHAFTPSEIVLTSQLTRVLFAL